LGVKAAQPDKAVTMRRAARLADGFKMMAPSALDRPRVQETFDTLRAYVTEAGRDADAFGLEARLVVQATPAVAWPRAFEDARAAGATHLGVANRIAGGGVQAQIDTLSAIAEATRGLW
jgi:alkanesulfonate monooxygenase SsuD/methylene tetrahydromethanopterin reductase-like flavin-dependent oxidoreductase (luciferase family)